MYPARPFGFTGGNGFVERIPGGLPFKALSAFINLSITDRVLSRWSRSKLRDSDNDKLKCTLNSAHHRIMSLSPWVRMSEQEREDSHLATYECCRLTAMLYSNGVVFPVPSACGWHIELLSQLQDLLEISRLQVWREDTSALLIWTLLISCIAAFRTNRQTFFETMLRDVLLDRGITSWLGVRAIVDDFAWTDAACLQGGMLIWDRLGLDATVG